MGLSLGSARFWRKASREPLGWSTHSRSVVNSCHQKETFSVCITDLPHGICINFLIINPVLITSKSSAENKSKGLSEAFVLISSASNSLPTSKFPITSSSPRAEEENKFTDTSSAPCRSTWQLTWNIDKTNKNLDDYEEKPKTKLNIEYVITSVLKKLKKQLVILQKHSNSKQGHEIKSEKQ